MKIAITGEQGFIGIHLRNYFKYILKYEVIELGKNYLETLPNIKDLDWLIHAAFIHRDKEPEKVLTKNRALTKKTIECLEQANLKCSITFLSSIQEDLDNYYGQSKKEAKKEFENYCKLNNSTFISLKLPNIFGPYAIPNKTSFIATFCYNLQNNIKVNYNENEVKLCYIEDVVERIATLKYIEIPSKYSTVKDVYNILNKFKKYNINKNEPSYNFNSKFELDLFHTYLSYSNYKK
jgi:UDP-2-acetamido-2,6-beta-L-arabino-hexul-4-ose reductase